MQCFQQKRQRWRHCVKQGNFIQSPKTEIFRKRTGNEVSTENVLIGRLSKIFIQSTLRKISSTYLKGHLKVFPEKPIIAFRKMKSIRNYIVRTDIKEADD